MVTNASLLLAKLVGLIHLLFIVYFIFGWLLPLSTLPWHLVAIVVVIGHWKCNNDQCLLTQWQRRLEGQSLSPDDEGQFVKSLFKKLGRSPSRLQLMWVIYGLLIGSGMISAGRLLLS